jgi:group I intron endonuclease
MTTSTLQARWRAHRSDAKNGSGLAIHNAIRKYGVENAILITLVQGVTREEAIELEMWWIQRLNTQRPDGYNLTAGGEGVWDLDEEARKRLSEKAKQQDLTKFIQASADARRGKPGPRLGQIVSEETRRKMSVVRMGRIPWNRGKSWSPEVRKKLSLAKIGRKLPEETKAKMRGPRGPYLKREVICDYCQ